MSRKPYTGPPSKRGLYDPAFEKDGCGVGFICDIKGRASREIIEEARNMNCSMAHRGGVGYEKNTGDGAGILTGIPDKFLRKVAAKDLGVELPSLGAYGVGVVFLPTDENERARCKKTLEAGITSTGQTLLGWRTLPVHPDDAGIGHAARNAMPHIEQLFIGAEDVAPSAR